MSSYTTRVRLGDDYVPPNSTQWVESRVNKVDFRSAEYIYSWRSRVSKFDLNDAQAGTILGVRAPKQTGNLFDVLADRKRFAEDLDAVAGGINSPTEAHAPQLCYSSTDAGHRFTSVKWTSIKQALRTSIDSQNPDFFRQDILHATPGAYRPRNVAQWGSVFYATAHPLTPPQLERQDRMNATLASMHPQAPTAKIGETVVDLLRGNLPSLLRSYESLRRLSTRGPLTKKALKTAGSEYLGVQFGWIPLVNDFISTIKVLTAIDHLIYGEANRRSRTIPWKSQIFSNPNYMDISGTGYGTPYGYMTSTSQGGAELNEQLSYDIRLTSRFAAIARPGIGANKFIDEAEDKIRNLGLWYPALGWDLLPYSWLLDWCTNLGASMNNALYYNTKGFMPLDYCWATSALKVLSTVTFNTPSNHRFRTWYEYDGSCRTFSVYKDREPATPFGFGLDLSGLSSSQLSILVALGLAKAR